MEIPVTVGRPMIDHDTYYPIIAFTLGSLAGLADLLRSGRKLGPRVICASFLWHGLLSTAAALLLSSQMESKAILYGVSILVGTGTYSIIDIVIAGIRAKIGAPK